MTAKFGPGGVAAAPLFGLGMFVRAARDPRVGAAFRGTYRALKFFGLRRDQNVFGFALWNALGAGPRAHIRRRASRNARRGS